MASCAILRAKFDNFANVLYESRPGKGKSPTCTDSLGKRWNARLYLGGTGDNRHVGIEISSVDETVVEKATFILRDKRGKVYRERSDSDDSLQWREFQVPEFANRSEILDAKNDILLDGSLVVDVLLQALPPVHVPSNHFGENMLKLLESDEDADVEFVVEDEIIAAHKLIVKANAPTLFTFLENGADGSPIPIKDMKADHFRIILRYIYGGDVSTLLRNTKIGDSKDLIKASDRLGVPGLKMEAEAAVVNSLVLKEDNVAEWLLFADSLTCPLLKEHAMAYSVARAADLVDSNQSKKLNGTPLMEELLRETSINSTNGNFGRAMSVTDLRKQLDGMGVDVDGTKEMLISRLEESQRSK